MNPQEQQLHIAKREERRLREKTMKLRTEKKFRLQQALRIKPLIDELARIRVSVGVSEKNSTDPQHQDWCKVLRAEIAQGVDNIRESLKIRT